MSRGRAAPSLMRPSKGRPTTPTPTNHPDPRPSVAFNALLLTLSTAGSLLFALKANMIQVRAGGRCQT